MSSDWSDTYNGLVWSNIAVLNFYHPIYMVLGSRKYEQIIDPSYLHNTPRHNNMCSGCQTLNTNVGPVLMEWGNMQFSAG